jgi:hypothetical protein
MALHDQMSFNAEKPSCDAVGSPPADQLRVLQTPFSNMHGWSPLQSIVSVSGGWTPSFKIQTQPVAVDDWSESDAVVDALLVHWKAGSLQSAKQFGSSWVGVPTTLVEVAVVVAFIPVADDAPPLPC